MATSTWGQIAREEHDPAHARRLAIGYVAGFAILAATLFAGATFGGVVRVDKAAEEEVDVKFVAKAPEPPPPAPPPPAPEPVAHVRQAVAAPAPLAIPVAVPTAIPTEKPAEAPVAQAVAAVPIGAGDPRGAAGGTGTGAAASTGTATVAASAPSPGNIGPIQLPEDAEPPVAITKSLPPYPEDARAQGIETTITVKFVVLESGEVTDVRILRGHPMFDALVIASVKTWRFQPATVQGRPIRVFRVTKIPFKLRT